MARQIECQKCFDDSCGPLTEIPHCESYSTCPCLNNEEDSYECDGCFRMIEGNYIECGDNFAFCNDDCLQKHTTDTDELRKIQKMRRVCDEKAKTNPFAFKTESGFEVLFAWPGATLPHNAIPMDVFRLLCSLYTLIGHQNEVQTYINTKGFADPRLCHLTDSESSVVQSALKRAKIDREQNIAFATKCCEDINVVITGIESHLSAKMPIPKKKVSLATLMVAPNETFFRGKRSEDHTCMHGFTSIFVPGQKFQYPTVGAVLNPTDKKYLQPEFQKPDETIFFCAWMQKNHGELLDRIMS